MTISRREFLATAAAAIASSALPTAASATISTRPRPTPQQLAWQRDELALFVHFGVNTFTDREWGDGTENPAIFNPTELDPRQWARAARAAGARALILTAKHHDGFCLWPSAVTQHSVAASPWRGGHGDVVREFTDACRAEGLRAGLYLSPWDRNARVYGDSPRYNDFYCAQLTELLTRYGALNEMWFDGANGEGPNGRRQVYDWPRIHALVRRLQPAAVMFSDAGPDVRWCGNEDGVAGDPNWSTIDPDSVPYPGASGAGVIAALQHGHPAGTVWQPAECDVSIRPGWFHHAAEDAQVKSVAALTELWFSSVGRNAKLLLNVPPTRNGLMHATDVARLSAWQTARNDIFAEDFAAGKRVNWRSTGVHSAVGEIDLGRSVSAGLVRLEEDIAHGQRIARYAVYGATDTGWHELTRGTTIGYRKLDRIGATPLHKLRVVIEDALDARRPLRIGIYRGLPLSEKA
ncbi:MAG: alpha-L-fucosidase [Gammaproteobacteria bacterium]|nr:MAG: alpha-L-fucosidase [Gammaproteobacteria bacterium]